MVVLRGVKFLMSEVFLTGAISNERVFVGDEVAPPTDFIHCYKLLCQRVLGYITCIGAISDERVFVGDEVAPQTC